MFTLGTVIGSTQVQKSVVGSGGLEPPTSAVTVARSQDLGALPPVLCGIRVRLAAPVYPRHHVGRDTRGVGR